MAQKRYKLLIWYFLPHHEYKTVKAESSREIELDSEDEVDQWVKVGDKRIAKACLIDTVNNTRKVILRGYNIERTIY